MNGRIYVRDSGRNFESGRNFDFKWEVVIQAGYF